MYKALGVYFDDHLNWNLHIDYVIKSCYGKLIVLRKPKRFTSYCNHKELAESLILSRLLDYCCALLYNTSKQQVNRLQKLLNATASFIHVNYSTHQDVLSINWLTTYE